MSADQQEGALKPIAPARVAEELKKLSSQRQQGQLDADEYEHRFAEVNGIRIHYVEEKGGAR